MFASAIVKLYRCLGVFVKRVVGKNSNYVLWSFLIHFYIVLY
jgi:cell division protein FtsX